MNEEHFDGVLAGLFEQIDKFASSPEVAEQLKNLIRQRRKENNELFERQEALGGKVSTEN